LLGSAQRRLLIDERRALAEWIDAVNALKEYGQWRSAISFNAADVDGIIEKFIGGKLEEEPSIRKFNLQVDWRH
jgi:hypothetical protein